MIILRTQEDLRRQIQAWKTESHKIGLVPTMGALHEGHLSLVKIAREKSGKIIASIFVNPAQFAPHEDFDSYPRDEKNDLAKFESAGVDLVYIPSVQEMYPDGVKSDVKAGSAAEGLESDIRPHFFGGVVSVVSRLFNHVQPDIAVFGEKDFQQLQVIREMNAGVEIIGGLIARDYEGLALSSRNAYLSPEELKIARRLNKVLFALAAEINDSPGEIHEIIASGIKKLIAAGFDEVQYLELRWSRLLAAVKIGKTRLIDNCAL